MGPVELSLVIPTFNERPNIARLVPAIATALQDIDWEAVFVDDSTDGTDDAIAAVSVYEPRVRLFHRSENRGGLSGAVVDGLAEAHGVYICVLDADLQHPPSRIPGLLAEARRSSADIVIASRYVPGGDAGGLAGPLRRAISSGLKGLTKAAFPRRLAGISDPLGGFFLIHRSVLGGVELRPVGYKILLEILVRCPWQTAAEVPYAFQPRLAGASKADLPQGLRFLRHLAGLAWDCSPMFAAFRVLGRSSEGSRQPEMSPTALADRR